MKPAVPLYRYQRRWIEDGARFQIGLWARQVGKTFSSSLKLALLAARAAAAGRSETWVILSRGQRQSDEVMRTAEKHLRAMDMGVRLEFDDVGAWEGEQIRQGLIALGDDVRIVGLPANPDTARGYSANVFLDEFAFHRDARKIWAAVFPMVTRGRKRLVVTSTPNGKSNRFYELWDKADGAWSRHRVSIHDAAADGYPADVDELRAGLSDEDAWRQEYELEFLDEASAWITFDKINAVSHADAGDPELYAGGPCYMGVDIARRKDLWVAWVAEEINGVRWAREIVARPNLPFRKQFEITDRLHRDYRIVRSAWDQTGMGEMPVEEAQTRYGASRVLGVLMTGPEKLDLATRMRDAFEDRRLRLPAGDMKLRYDLHALRCVSSASGGTPRFLVDGETDGHADRAWACALCEKAADLGTAHYAYRPVRRHARPPRPGERSQEQDDRASRPVRARKLGEFRPTGASLS